jgi:hypothetical protein
MGARQVIWGCHHLSVDVPADVSSRFSSSSSPSQSKANDGTANLDGLVPTSVTSPLITSPETNTVPLDGLFVFAGFPLVAEVFADYLIEAAPNHQTFQNRRLPGYWPELRSSSISV